MINTVNDTLRTMVDAIKDKRQATDDCKDIVDGAFEKYEAGGGKLIKKVLVATATAIAKSETQDAETFHEEVANLLSQVNGPLAG
jgi:hypothetical protein